MSSIDILSDIRIVEVSAFVAAPLGGMTLAQMGAEVIRIDPPSGGLDYRRWPVVNSADGTKEVSLFWTGLNKHKKSVSLDITKPEGKELAQQLITAPGENAGILLTNMPPRGWLDYETLRARRTDLIQLTVQGDRHGGSAVDYTLNPRLGLPYLTGPKDYPGPVNHVLPAWDLVTGQMAALGLLAAERYRSKTRSGGGGGVGQHVKLPLEDVALSLMSGLGFVAEAERGEERARYGNDLFGAFGRDFLTSDGRRVMVVGLTQKQWRNLVAACGVEDGISDLESRLGRDFNLEGDRFKSSEEIAGLFDSFIRGSLFSDIATRFDAHGVCWGKYQTVKELLNEDPACSTDNPMFKRVVQPDIGATLTPATPLNFSTGRQDAKPAPRLGEHTEQILQDLLKISSGEFGRLIDRGIAAVA